MTAHGIAPDATTTFSSATATTRNERRTWMVIGLCTVMMVAEIVGGLLFGSIALVADGLHMSHACGALLLAALAYTYARRHADDERFSFGTGKFGDLAGFTSAIILAMIALLIGYEAVTRLIWPVRSISTRRSRLRCSDWRSMWRARCCSAAAARSQSRPWPFAMPGTP